MFRRRRKAGLGPCPTSLFPYGPGRISALLNIPSTTAFKASGAGPNTMEVKLT